MISLDSHSTIIHVNLDNRYPEIGSQIDEKLFLEIFKEDDFLVVILLYICWINKECSSKTPILFLSILFLY